MATNIKGQGKGKMRFWRKMSEKRYEGTSEIRTGRALRDAMRGMNHPGFITPFLVTLFKHAGISTPVLDKELTKQYTNNKAEESEIEDAVIISETKNEGVVNATA